jgi:hypothetical protein
LGKVVIFLGAMSGMSGCSEMNKTNESEMVTVIFDTGHLTCRSIDPDENKISDINLLVFDEYGRLEKDIWLDTDGISRCDISLTTDKIYRFAALVNFGYKTNLADSSELERLKYHLAYPDEYKKGIPMYADAGYILVRNGLQVQLKLIRLMSKISIRLDRSQLSEGIEMNVAGIRIGNCPRSVSVFSKSRVESPDDCFPLGFNKNGEQCSALNRIESKGLSYSVSLYMLENIQGKFSDKPLNNDSEKTFGIYDPRRETCSYIELDIDYASGDKVSSDGYLKYRFYLGEDRDDLSLERNCHYRITICPKDDGLSGDGWRVDKEAITSTLPPTFSYYPESYIRGDIGDQIHIGCRFTPDDAPFDVGLEYMENDKKEGIYDYVIDDDGHGAVITLTGPGSGLIYMSAGYPVNESALWFIEVNQPVQKTDKWSNSATYLER